MARRLHRPARLKRFHLRVEGHAGGPADGRRTMGVRPMVSRMPSGKSLAKGARARRYSRFHGATNGRGSSRSPAHESTSIRLAGHPVSGFASVFGQTSRERLRNTFAAWTAMATVGSTKRAAHVRYMSQGFLRMDVDGDGVLDANDGPMRPGARPVHLDEFQRNSIHQFHVGSEWGRVLDARELQPPGRRRRQGRLPLAGMSIHVGARREATHRMATTTGSIAPERRRTPFPKHLPAPGFRFQIPVRVPVFVLDRVDDREEIGRSTVPGSRKTPTTPRECVPSLDPSTVAARTCTLSLTNRASSAV